MNRHLFTLCHEKGHNCISNTQTEGQANLFTLPFLYLRMPSGGFLHGKLSDYATHQFRRHSWTSRINLLMRFWGRGGAPKEQDAGQVGSHWAGVQEISISVAELPGGE